MMQQVNLFSFIPAVKKEWLCANHVLKAWLGLIIILSVYGFYPLGHLYFLSKDLSALKIAEIEAAQRFQTIASRYPNISHEPLQKQIASLVKNISSKSKLLNTITVDPENKYFSKYLYLLARVVPEDMWLTELHIIPDSKTFFLKGYSLSSIAPAQLLANLKKEKIMNLYEIKLAQLVDDPKNKNKNVWTFTINTETQEKQPQTGTVNK